MNHVVLLGDSIFDNASYVPGEPPVIKQLQSGLPEPWRATLLAVDGDVTLDVIDQLEKLPGDASHLVVSCGGNDALEYRGRLSDMSSSGSDGLRLIAEARANFDSDYDAALDAVMSHKIPIAVCTIYDSIPDLEPIEQAALAIFNEIILRHASARKIPILDLRLICTESTDYSAISSIEPSAHGGEKIAMAIRGLLLTQDSAWDQCVILS